jgi:membrane fusion protein, multidrug efflux system
LLAELDTPDLAGQAAQARANLINAQAAQRLSAATATRYDALFAQGAVSRQDKDEKDADLAAKNATVAAAQAGLYSVASQENFRRLVVPFDGVVTSRAVDVGALVTIGNNATPLFTVADESKLRIYVRVPQNYASHIQPGMTVSFTVPQYPGRTFQASLVASAGAVASATGTVLAQFGMDNHDAILQPGTYAEVKFPLPPGANGIRVPATALMFRDEGMQVATVDASNHVKLKTVMISRDMGATVDVGSGISSQDRIIDNPADALQEGDEVRIAGK